MYQIMSAEQLQTLMNQVRGDVSEIFDSSESPHSDKGHTDPYLWLEKDDPH